MKHTYLFKGLVGCAIGLGLVCAASGQSVPGKARVVRMGGHARFTTGNNVWQPVKVGDVFGAGTIIQTDQAKGSYVDLALANGKTAVGGQSAPSDSQFAPITANIKSYQPSAEQNVVRIWENSALGIDNLSAMNTGADTVSDTQLDLRAGHIFGTVKKMSAGSKYEIKLPKGVAGIRGTCFDLWDNGLLRIGNGAGVISLLGDGGQPNTVNVPGGHEFNPGTGQVGPLPQNIIDLLNGLETRTRFYRERAMAELVPDRTIEHVSHHRGDDDDQGGDGDDQGGDLSATGSHSKARAK